MLQQLLRTKSVVPHGTSGLKKCLTAFDLALLGIGCAIGTGIFVLTGLAAATQSGPAVVLSFIFAGIASGFAVFLMPSWLPLLADLVVPMVIATWHLANLLLG